MPTSRTHPTLRLAATACSLLAALGLAGCDMLPVGQKNAPPSSATTSWGDWVDLPFASSVVVAKDGLVVLHNHDDQTLGVYNAKGEKQWDLPDVKMVESGWPVVEADDDYVYPQLANGSVAALDWKTGEQKWKFETSKIDECAPADHFTLVGSGRTAPKLSGDEPLVLSYESGESASTESGGEWEGEGKLSQPPEKCMGQSNASMPSITTLVGIDRDSGKQKWDAKDGGINVIQQAVPIADGSGVAHIVSHRGYPGISMTDVRSGETKDAPLVAGDSDSLTQKGYQSGDNVMLRPLNAETYFVYYGVEGENLVRAHVEKWNPKDSGSGKVGKTALTEFSSQRPCESDPQTSPQGYVYCLLPAGTQNSSASHGALLANPGEAIGNDAPKAWEHNGPPTADGEEGNVGDGPTSYGQPLIPREGQSPLIALPGASAAVEGIDMTSGDRVWKTDAQQLAQAQTSTATASGSAGPMSPGDSSDEADSDDGEDDGESSDGANTVQPAKNYIPGVNEVQVATSDSACGIDAGSGEVKWCEKVTGGSLGMVTAAGGFIDLKIDGENSTSGSRLRAVTSG